jgi:hypothetical protein
MILKFLAFALGASFCIVANAEPNVAIIGNSQWSGPVPSEISISLRGGDSSYPLSECGKFKDSVLALLADRAAAARSFKLRRTVDPVNAPFPFQRKFQLVLPAERNFLSHQERERLSAIKPAEGVSGLRQWVLPAGIYLQTIEAAEVLTNGPMQALARQLGLAPASFSLAETAPGQFEISIGSADLYCDLLTTGGTIKTNAIAWASSEAEANYRSFYDPLVQRMDGLFERNIGTEKRAALLGFQVGAYLEEKMLGLSLESKQKLAEAILDRFISFPEVTRTQEWKRALSGKMRSTFESDSAPFSISLKLILPN